MINRPHGSQNRNAGDPIAQQAQTMAVTTKQGLNRAQRRRMAQHPELYFRAINRKDSP
jgi:hypothetical protein